MPNLGTAAWLRLLTLPPDPESDRDLLHRYAELGDRAALETLIHRHAGLVYGVCRRLLSNPADVDDAVQAVFLVLMKKPTAVRNPGALPAWLHGTARRTALKLRSRRRTEAAVDVPTTDADPSWAEVRTAIDAELANLPAKYQGPVIRVLVLEETQPQAAAELGLSLSTLKRRLDAGRECLKRRLERRGIQPLFLLAPLPGVDRLGTAALHAVARPLLSNGHSVVALELSQGVIFAMLQMKLKVWTVGLMLTAGTITGTGFVAVQGQQGTGPGTTPAPAAKGKGEPVKPVPDAKPIDLRTRVGELEAINEQLRTEIISMNFEKSRMLADIGDARMALPTFQQQSDRADELKFLIEKAKLRVLAAESSLRTSAALAKNGEIENFASVRDRKMEEAKLLEIKARSEVLEAEFDIKKAERELAAMPVPRPVVMKPTAAPAPPKPAANEAVRKLREEQLTVAEEHLKNLQPALTRWPLTTEFFSEIHQAVETATELRLALKSNKPADRIRILSESVELLREIETKIKPNVDMGRVSFSAMAHAKMARIAAEIRLREEEAEKPAK